MTMDIHDNYHIYNISDIWAGISRKFSSMPRVHMRRLVAADTSGASALVVTDGFSAAGMVSSWLSAAREAAWYDLMLIGLLTQHQDFFPNKKSPFRLNQREGPG